MSQVIRDLAHLTALSSRPEGLDCHIVLAGGLARSSKHINALGPRSGQKVGRFDVFNEIDDTWQVLFPRQLWTQSNIGAALDAGALIADD
jgi:hypothetical protein